MNVIYIEVCLTNPNWCVWKATYKGQINGLRFDVPAQTFTANTLWGAKRKAGRSVLRSFKLAGVPSDRLQLGYTYKNSEEVLWNT